MGASREKRLRQAARKAKDIQTVEHELHKETVALLDAMRQAGRLAKGRIMWLESCVQEYRRLKGIGLIVDPF